MIDYESPDTPKAIKEADTNLVICFLLTILANRLSDSDVNIERDRMIMLKKKRILQAPYFSDNMCWDSR